jgi:methylenetetrahydrofolate--tRNA-(uracil-5-)-methyltransferase
MSELVIVGGGLAGCEAAWQAAQRGIQVDLYEMRPIVETGAHQGEQLAELVCSNSLGSKLIDRASGLLQEEVRQLGSLLLRCAEDTSLPAGGALAVDRVAFASRVTGAISGNPNIRLIREEVTDIPHGPTVIASGPLTSNALSKSIARLTGVGHLYFYDAISPIVTSDSINLDIAFQASRYNRSEQEGGDYINCPFTHEQYYAFVEELVHAERIELKEFESSIDNGVRAGADLFFEGCLPVEILASRGKDSLAFGPMRPVGLINPHTGGRAFAVIQLRQDNLAASLYNLVGFQTNLKFPEQRRIFRMIPGLEQADFARYGQMHRNTFIFAPAHLRATLQYRNKDDLFFAGQITGVEGYVGNIATGLLAGLNAARLIKGQNPIEPPGTTMIGALCRYITSASEKDFQPMKANFGIMPPLEGLVLHGKSERARAYVERALQDLDHMVAEAQKDDVI